MLKTNVSSLEKKLDSFMEIRQNKECSTQQLAESVVRPQPNQTVKDILLAPSRLSYASAVATSASSSSIATQVVQLQRPRPDRRFNLIIFGIEEPSKCTPSHIRSNQNINAAISILSSVNPSIFALSTRDCYRLGKYSKNCC